MDLTEHSAGRVPLSCSVVGMTASLGLGIMSLVVDDEGRHGSGIGLFVLSGIVGLGTVVAVRAINERSWLSPWLLVGLVVPPGQAAGAALSDVLLGVAHVVVQLVALELQFPDTQT